MKFLVKSHNWSSHIFRAGSRLSDMTTDFVLDAPSVIECSGYVNFKHRNIAPGAVFVSTRVGYRSYEDASELPAYPSGARSLPLWQDLPKPLTWIPGAKDGGNLRDVTHHYLTLNVSTPPFILPAGAHRLEVWAFSGTDSAGFTTRDDLVEVNRDTNQTNAETFGYFATKIHPIAIEPDQEAQ